MQIPSTPYQFAYSGNSFLGYGEIKSVTTPYGSQTVYQYFQEGLAKSLSTLLDNPVTTKQATHDSVTDPAWTYAFTNTSSTITNPDGGQVISSFDDPKILSNWKRGLVSRVERPGFSVTERVWAQNKAYGRTGSSTGDPNNPFVQQERASVANTAGSQVKTVITNFTYDKNGNVLSRTEYAWVAYGVTTGSTPLRTTTSAYYVPAPNSSDVSDSPYAYWWPHNGTYWPDSTSARRLNAVKRRVLSDPASNCTPDSDGGATCAIDELTYDNAYQNGNLTVAKHWDSVKAASPPTPDTLSGTTALVQTRSYDSYGNLTDILEPELRTHLTYGQVGSFTNLYPTQIVHGSGTVRTQNLVWDSGTGLLSQQTDVENSTTMNYQYDGLGRRKQVVEAGLRQINTVYDDVARTVWVKRDLRANTDGLLQTVTHYDQLGRARKVRTSDGAPLTPTDESGGIKVDSHYFVVNGGEYRTTSNPYRSTGDPTMGWTCTQLDRVGGVTQVSTYDGAVESANCGSASNRSGSATTTYDADKTTITDAAGSTRDRYVDAAGRLVSVTEHEPAVYTTTYLYNPMNDLRKVTQGGQTRTFVYTSLSRLKSATNPESGTIVYTYYDSGEIFTKTDGPAVTTYTYDGLHRIKGKSYAGVSTPEVTYSYFLTGAPKVGRLQSVSTSAASMSYDYDTLGRVTTSLQTITGASGAYSFSNYSYLLNDVLTSVKYPSGRVMAYEYDDAGRVVKIKDPNKPVTALPYADLTAVSVATERYTVAGQLSQMKLGNGLWEKREYNALGQATSLKLGTSQGANNVAELGYTYMSGSNNGNVHTHTITLPGLSRTQSFGYDLLNRLTSAQEAGSWSRSYGYDQFGNRWVSSSNGLRYADPNENITPTTPFDASTNKLEGLGYTDGRGNLNQYNPHTLTYDAENRLVGTSSPSSGSLDFSYDGEGRRVKKVWTPTGGTAVTKYYVYDALGNLTAEYGGAAGSDVDTKYVFADHLGSTRVKTSATGQLITRHDYLPFGRQLSAGDGGRTTAMGYVDQADPMQEPFPIKFTSKERDAETGLDYFEARYFSGAQGRFMSPDQPFNDQDEAEPQSWNLYSYTRNNPLRFVDPTGRCSQAAGGYTDEGSGLFPGPCSGGTIGDSNNNKNSVTVGVGRDEANLIMLQMIGEQLSSPHQWADLVSNAGQAAGSVLAPLPTAIAQCATGNCDKTNIALAMIPHVPGVPGTSVGRFVKNQKLRNILAAFNRTGTGVGTGSTADAIRSEIQTGNAVGGKFHFQKGEELRRGLLGLLRNPSLDPSDRAVVKELLTDIQDALSTPRK